MIKFAHLIFGSLIFIGGNSFSQCEHTTHHITPDFTNGWIENSQSKIVELHLGDDFEMKFIAQAGVKYRIQTSAGQKDFTKNNISFQLIIKEVNRIVEKGIVSYKTAEVILYDSELSGKDDEAIIQTAKTQNLSIKVRIHGTEIDPNLAFCSIVLIEEKRSESHDLR
ncbi:hypothetical protein ERX46_17045 [Brumimicrobium glaciale]|uniref:Uncharacterized protein n=1 Tax=Brumimicrobium glaciale TaxID=200475 RepID=A0A4Q4KEB4_9FLAO|nr:hypothetical protein [Brumimicrobium glaciale]RYM30787.1 hypothetical protein ERX46_17045 [Brumimicrobium glaciale]